MVSTFQMPGGIPNLGQQQQPSPEQTAKLALLQQLNAMAASIYVAAASDFCFCGKSEDRPAEFRRIAAESHTAARIYLECRGVEFGGDSDEQ